jgi:hypothetical protein
MAPNVSNNGSSSFIMVISSRVLILFYILHKKQNYVSKLYLLHNLMKRNFEKILFLPLKILGRHGLMRIAR